MAAMDLTIAELARAVGKNETHVRQHIHRKHLTTRQDGRNVFVALDDATRWARERGLPFGPPVRALATAGEMKDRAARMTVLTWHGPDVRSRNLFTLVRHRRKDALGPWASEPGEEWSNDDLGHGLRMSSLDTTLERCQALIDHIVGSGTLEIDGVEIDYDLYPIPRHHWAYRDERPLARSSVRSPFSRHSSEITEYWSFGEDPRKRWLEVVASTLGGLPSELARLPLRPTRHVRSHRPSRKPAEALTGSSLVRLVPETGF